MEKPAKAQIPESPSTKGSLWWNLAIYACIAATLISLIFASCTGGEVYNPKDKTSATPPLGTVAPSVSMDITFVNEDGTSTAPSETPSPSPEG